MGVIEEILRVKDEASGPLKGAGETAGRTGITFGKATAAAGAMSAGLLAAGTAAIKFMQHISDLRNELGDMATRTGLATETIAGLKLAAEGSGQSLGQLEGSIRGVTMRITAAEQGSKNTVDAFAKLGLSMADLDAMTLEQTFAEVASRLQGVDDAGERASLALETMGRSGGSLMQALGDTALEDFVERAKLGVDVSEAGAEAADDWQRKMADLKLVLEGVASTIGDVLGPTTTTWLGDFTTGLAASTKFLGEFFKSLREGESITMANARASDAGFRAAAALAGFDPDAVYDSAGNEFTGFLTSAPMTMRDIIGPSVFDMIREQAGIGQGFAPADASATTGGGSSSPAAKESLGKYMRFHIIEPMIEAATADPKIKSRAIEAGRLAVEAIAAGAEQAAAEAAARQQRLMSIAGGIQGAGALLSSPGSAIPGMLGALGPAGAIAGSSLGLLQTLGKSGAGGVREQFTMFVDAIIAGLHALPEILLEVLPEFVGALVLELPPAIYEALKGLFTGIADKARGNEQLKAIRREEREASGRRGRLGVSLSRIFGGRGGRNDDVPGVGEELNSARGGNANSGGGRHQTINIHGAVTPAALDYMMREQDKALGEYGRRLTLGGA